MLALWRAALEAPRVAACQGGFAVAPHRWPPAADHQAGWGTTGAAWLACAPWLKTCVLRLLAWVMPALAAADLLLARLLLLALLLARVLVGWLLRGGRRQAPAAAQEEKSSATLRPGGAVAWPRQRRCCCRCQNPLVLGRAR